MRDATPLIICGMGRSGTRNTANVLNCHESVSLYGEIPFGIMKQLFNVLDTADKSYSGKDYHRSLWSKKKAKFIYSSFNYLGKASLMQEKHTACFIGHKTPHHEKLFYDYERHFGSVGILPIYLYCCRDADSCWRSYKSMNWGAKRTIESFLVEYNESFNCLEHMLSKAEGRVHIVKLNDLKSANNQLEYYIKAIFNPLGLEIDDDTAMRIASVENSNATIKVTGKPPVELDFAEIKLIEDNKSIRDISFKYFS
jgi:hypothetical protein